MKKIASKNMKKGFSILEIIFAIVILGVIASVAIPKLMSSKDDASLSSIKQDIRTTITSIQSYYIVNEKIDKILDAISLNSSTWDIDDKKVIYYEDDLECVTIQLSVEDNIDVLKLIINSENKGNICTSLINDGFTDQTYDLN